MRRPSTRMIWRSGSTLAPYLRTITPSTSTPPSPISSSPCPRLPTPPAAPTSPSPPPPPPPTTPRAAAAARARGSGATASGREARGGAGRAGPAAGRAGRDAGPPPLGSRPGGLMPRVLFVVEVIGKERGQLRQVVQRRQAEALQEV